MEESLLLHGHHGHEPDRVLVGNAVRFTSLRSRLLWDRVPLVPLSVTATQAASGRYDGSLIELDGTLQKREVLPNGDVKRLLREGAQSFSVHVPSDLFSAGSPKLETGSRIRAQGICTDEVPDAASRETFTLLASSSSDLVRLSGPPWWSGQRLIWVLSSCLSLLAISVYVSIAFERAKLRVAHEERERLSHDMHDTLAQSLAGVGFKLQGIRRSMRASNTIPPAILQSIDATCDMVTGTHREASASIAALHPASQKEGDLLTLLERSVFLMLRENTKRFSDFPS